MANDDYFNRMYTEKGAITSDKNGTRIFHSTKVMEDPYLLDRTAFELMWELMKCGCDLSRITKVVGVGKKSELLAAGIARHISENNDDTVLGVFTEESKDSQGRTTMVFTSTSVQAGDCVVLCTDEFTLCTDTLHTAQAVEEKGAFLLPYVTAIVNCTKTTRIMGIEIASILHGSLNEPLLLN